MRAIVLNQEARIVLVERPVPVPAPDEVLVRVGAAGICGTDLHAPFMPALFTPDVVLGHEFSGTVAAWGADVAGLDEGQPIVVNPIALSCDACTACARGFTNHCPSALADISGVARDGGMADMATVSRRAVHLIPEGLSVRDAAWTEPLAAAARGVSHGAVGAGSTVAILGAGAIGQLVLQLVLNVGVGETLVVEPSQLRRKVAVACGASSVLSPEQLDEVDRQFDVVFDCTGSPEALASTLSLVGHGGRVVVLGSYTSPITLESVRREATLVFSAVYRNSEEFAGALRLLSRGVVDVAPLTTAALPLEHFEDAFAAMRDPDRSVKVLLAPYG